MYWPCGYIYINRQWKTKWKDNRMKLQELRKDEEDLN